jgi:hypothetical protein
MLCLPSSSSVGSDTYFRGASGHQWSTIPELPNAFHGADFFAAPALLLEVPDRKTTIIHGEIHARLRRGKSKNARTTGGSINSDMPQDEVLVFESAVSIFVPKLQGVAGEAQPH